MKANQAVTPACFWRGSRDFNESGFPPETCGNDNLRLSCFVVTAPGHGGWRESRLFITTGPPLETRGGDELQAFTQ
jgi:hypothetical protein